VPFLRPHLVCKPFSSLCPTKPVDFLLLFVSQRVYVSTLVVLNRVLKEAAPAAYLVFAAEMCSESDFGQFTWFVHLAVTIKAQ
jgi:hypothetical protein